MLRARALRVGALLAGVVFPDLLYAFNGQVVGIIESWVLRLIPMYGLHGGPSWENHGGMKPVSYSCCCACR